MTNQSCQALARLSSAERYVSHSRRYWLGIVLGAFLFSDVTAVYAAGAIEEIVVTARKRDESLQEIPLAVTAWTGEQLVERNVMDIVEMAAFVPSLQTERAQYANSNAVLRLRGQVAGGNQMNNDPAVSVLIDGVNVPHPVGLVNQFFDLERVEVLRGPQGTLFGRNTTGGAVQFITRKPDHDGVHGFVSADGGDSSLFAGRAAVNVPLIDDKLAVRLGVQRSKRDGYGRSAANGVRLGGVQDETFFRGSLLFEPSDTVSIFISGDHLRERETQGMHTLREWTGQLTNGLPFNALGLSFDPASNCTPGDVACATAEADEFARLGTEDFFTNYADEPMFDNGNAWGLNATIEIDLSDTVTLKSITGYREFWNDHQTDFDGMPHQLVSTGLPRFPDRTGSKHQESKVFSQEFNLSGIALDGRLQWLGGAYYSNDEGADRDWVDLGFGVALTGVPWQFTFDAPVVDQSSWAIFSQATYELTEALSLTLGGRFTEEKKRQESQHRTVPAVPIGFNWICGNGQFLPGPTSVFVNNGEECRGSPLNGPPRQKSFDGWSWLVSLDWTIRDDMLVYIKTAKGFRGGGFDIRTPLADAFEPETATDIELGLKAEFFDSRLRANVAGFRTDYSNKQETTIILISGSGSTVTLNAADATLYGLELELLAEPAEGLTFTAMASWFDGEYDSFPDALLLNPTEHPDNLDGTGFFDASGDAFPFEEWSYALSGRYEFPVGPGRLGTQLSWTWRDKLNPSRGRTDFAVSTALWNEFQEDVGLMNARIDYDMEEWGFNVAFFVTNLLDKEYQLIGVGSNICSCQYGMTQEPRLWGVTATKRFGNE